MCEDNDYFYYDSSLSRIYDRFMHLIDFSENFNWMANRSYSSPTFVLFDDDYYNYHAESKLRAKQRCFDPKYIQRLEIIIGNKCNYRCKYCMQSGHVDPDDPYDFNVFRQRFEKSHLLDTVNDIHFTGGEPLVYWKRLKRFIEYFRVELGFNGRITYITNGELFDKEKLEFTLKHGVRVCFSHDAQAQTIYRHETDFLKNPETKALVIEQLKAHQYARAQSYSGFINFVVNPTVYNLFDAIDYFNEELYDGVPVDIRLMLKLDRHNKFILSEWTPEKLNEAYKAFKKAYLLPKDSKYFNNVIGMRELLYRIMHRFVNNLPAALQLSRCPNFISNKRLTCNYNGDSVMCWASFVDRSIVNGEISKVKEIKFMLHSIHDHPECFKCPYVLGCGSVCPTLSGEDFDIRCKSLNVLMRAQTEAAMSMLLNKIVKEIVPCDMPV